jgi:hypothetical protein
MTDPLEKLEVEGRTAGRRIVQDLILSNDLDECVSQVRLAASVDSKFNWHLIEAIVSLAATALEDSTTIKPL